MLLETAMKAFDVLRNEGDDEKVQEYAKRMLWHLKNDHKLSNESIGKILGVSDTSVRNFLLREKGVPRRCYDKLVDAFMLLACAPSVGCSDSEQFVFNISNQKGDS